MDLIKRAKELNLPLLQVVTKDELAEVKHKHGSYGIIVNLQDDYDIDGNDLTGTHWVLVYIEDGDAIYFDPIGFEPPADIQIWLYPYRPYPVSKEQIQDQTRGYCGEYCLYCLYFMEANKQINSLRKRLEAFLTIWSDDPEENEELLKKRMNL